jgi:hypothetical protein
VADGGGCARRPRSIGQGRRPDCLRVRGRDRRQPGQRDDADKPDDRASTIELLASQFLDQRLHHDAFGDEARAVVVHPVEQENVGRQRTIRFPNDTCTGSLFWFSVVVLTLMTPWSGRDFDARIWSTSLSTRSSSPGRTGRGQRNSSNPAPTMPPAGLISLSTNSLIVIAAVCQPLAARPRKIESAAALSSR